MLIQRVCRQMVVICTQCLLSLLSLWAITSHLWQENKLQGKPKYPVSTHRGCVSVSSGHTHTPEYTNTISDGSCTNIESSKTCKILPPLIRSHLNGQETSNSDVFDSVIYQCKNCSDPYCRTSGFVSLIWQTKTLKVINDTINHTQSVVQNNFVGECDVFCLF